MTERRVLIADDEPLARERIRLLLDAADGAYSYRVVAECGDGDEALAAIERERPDLVFLDISMPGPDGVQVARLVIDLEPMPTVVFVTAHREFALDAFEVSALDYLVKPVDRDRFAQMLERFERRQHGAAAPLAEDVRAALARLLEGTDRRKRFVVRGGRGHYFLRTEEIESATADGNYVCLTSGGRLHLIRETLKAFEAAVDPTQFVRIHRSIMVNIDYIVRVEPLGHGEFRVIMKSGARLEASRRYSHHLRALLQ